MQLLLTVSIWLMMGAIASYYAKERGRNPQNWFVIGLLLGILGLALLFLLPRITRKPTLVQVKRQEVQFVPKKSEPHKFWYYLDPENKQFGPMSLNGLKSALKDGKIDLQTYVWNEDLESWKKFGEVVSAPSPSE